MSDDALRRLADRAGLMNDWAGYDGEPHTVAPDTLRAVLGAMGLDADDPEASERQLAETQGQPDFVTGTVGEPFRIDAAGRARLERESGEGDDVDPGRVIVDEPGYHRLLVGDRAITLAVAPRRAPSARDLSGRDRLWGAAVQLYALRAEGRAVGDFAALSDFARAAGRAGADLLAISPAHALFAADPERFSPYAPSSRDFVNILYADPGGAGEEAGDALVDWPAASAQRLARLRDAFARFDGDAGFDDFVREGGEPLRQHALFEALDAQFAPEQGSGWQNWPEAYRDPGSPAVADFAAERQDAVRFHLFAQWLADRGLRQAQQAARDAGMAVGLVSDLAVGLDPGGSHAWARRDELIAGLGIGAPPDGFQPEGQGWGITGFSPIALRRLGFEPYLRTLRAALAHAGGVRIDHALGLGRLWVIPEGGKPLDGCYLRYPLGDMLRLLTLEAHRHRALIVGEDLGTVPDGFRDDLGAHHLLGMSILSFERGEGGTFEDPAGWRPASAAMTSTHDLPPIAGWWRGRDMELRDAVGIGEDTSPEKRGEERAQLWTRAVASGLASGEPPPVDAPEAAVDAAVALTASSACELAVIPAEDLLGLFEMPNLPGTTDQHPNWRRRYAAPADTLFADPAVQRRAAILREHRP